MRLNWGGSNEMITAVSPVSHPTVISITGPHLQIRAGPRHRFSISPDRIRFFSLRYCRPGSDLNRCPPNLHKPRREMDAAFTNTFLYFTFTGITSFDNSCSVVTSIKLWSNFSLILMLPSRHF